MNPPKSVLCAMDLSLFGRSSIAVAMPILAACGVQGCPLPTALFSTHTGGFDAVEKRDQADFCFSALEHFAREGITFDAVYTGYLYGEAQFRLARAALSQYPDAFHLVDPAMADHGKLYTGFGPDAVANMQDLCSRAQLITPNVTESALLLGEDPTTTPSAQQLDSRLKALSEGKRDVLITSAPADDGTLQTIGRTAAGKVFFVPARLVPQHYPGTGDSLASAVCGLVLSGHSLETATRKAAQFVEGAAAATYAGGGVPRSGLWMEHLLRGLMPDNKERLHE